MIDAEGAGADTPAPPVILVDTQTAAVAIQVSPATIRQWATRGRIARQGRDHKGRTMYDLQQIMDQAKNL